MRLVRHAELALLEQILVFLALPEEILEFVAVLGRIAVAERAGDYQQESLMLQIGHIVLVQTVEFGVERILEYLDESLGVSLGLARFRAVQHGAFDSLGECFAHEFGREFHGARDLSECAFGLGNGVLRVAKQPHVALPRRVLVLVRGLEYIVEHFQMKHGRQVTAERRHHPDPVGGTAAPQVILVLVVFHEGLGGRMVVRDGNVVLLVRAEYSIAQLDQSFVFPQRVDVLRVEAHLLSDQRELVEAIGVGKIAAYLSAHVPAIERTRGKLDAAHVQSHGGHGGHTVPLEFEVFEPGILGMRDFHLVDQLLGYFEHFGVLAVRLQNKRQHVEVGVFGRPAEFHAHVGELDVGLVAHVRVVVQFVAGVHEVLTVPEAEVFVGLGALPEYGDCRADDAAVVGVAYVVADGLEHAVGVDHAARVEQLQLGPLNSADAARRVSSISK